MSRHRYLKQEWTGAGRTQGPELDAGEGLACEAPPGAEGSPKAPGHCLARPSQGPEWSQALRQEGGTAVPPVRMPGAGWGRGQGCGSQISSFLTVPSGSAPPRKLSQTCRPRGCF